MSVEMNELLEHIRLSYQLGERLYTELRDKRPADADVIISPRQIGDTIWLCAFAKSYKAQYNSKRILMVIPESQKDFMQFFPSVDLVLPVDSVDMDSLRIFIGINELWKDSHVVYAHMPFSVAISKNGVFFHEHSDTNSMLEITRAALGLTENAVVERMTVPQKPFSEALQERYRNAVMLVPGANSLKQIPASFWNTLSRSLREKGIRLYSNYNGLDCEHVVEGTEPLASSFSELVELCRYFRAFVCMRSGICDLIAGTDANLICLWPTHERNGDLSVHPAQQNHADLSVLGRTKGIWNYQFQPDMETELISQIISII
ncbi:MAG: hypothetical protein IK016_02200 [Lachnospiraceae bacterium]|nr:hypothetical protein [Lachnospiraceae bacterium]